MIFSSKPSLSLPFQPGYEALSFLTGFFGVQSDLNALITQSGLQQNETISTLDLLRLAKKTGLRADIQRAALDDIRLSNGACMMLAKDSAPYPFIIALPTSTHPNQVFIPGKGLQTMPLEECAQHCSEHMILFRLGSFKVGADNAHMRKGHSLDWFWSPIWQYWSNYSEVVLCSLFINLFVLALPLFTLNVYDRVIPNNAQDTLAVLTTGVFLALGFDLILKLIRNYILEHIAANVGKKHDFDLMERIMLIRDQDFPVSTGEKMNIFRELQGIRDFYAAKLAPTIIDLPFLFFFIAVIFVINPLLSLIPLIGAAAIFAINFFARGFVNRLTERYFASMQKKSSVLVETLIGAQTFRMFNAIGHRLFHWNGVVEQATDVARHNQFIASSVSFLSVTIMNMVTVFVIFFGAHQINEGNLTIGGLIAVTILAGRSIGPVMGVAGFIGQLRKAQDVLRTIDNIFKLPHEGDLSKPLSNQEEITGKIEIQNVAYFYKGQPRPAIKIDNLVLQPGEKMGLIGRSGAGKSTLTKLISNSLQGYDGHIWLDQYALTAMPPSVLRDMIGIVPQHGFFFQGTVHDNIVMGRDHISEDNIKRAIDVSGVALVFQDSGYGLDMVVRENGENLTGGQRQAISLARALVHDPKILIFDEPTTGMDQVLEGHVKAKLHEYLKDKSFVMITHRTTLLPLVDRLVLLDKGQILADGPRDEILKKLNNNPKSA